ncbi:MAG: MXAN_6640 family putative metalloprotease [Actinomycetota bacterium]
MRSRACVAATIVLTVVLGVSSAPSGAAANAGRPAVVHHRASGARPDALSRALAAGRITRAQYSFQRALSIFRPRSVARRFGRVERPADASLALTDLAVRVRALPAPQRRVARQLLARPNDTSNDGTYGIKYKVKANHVCNAKGCIWWVPTTREAPSSTDTAPHNTLPDWIDATRQTFDTIWSTEIDQYGFRAPLSDLTSANHGPNGRIDVFIGDVGRFGLYGYCTTDDPKIKPKKHRQASAYCVLDNNMSPKQFSTGANGVAALQVTFAHEFFHAVQFGYDVFEDRWLMEGTAVWMEDQVFDDVNDNLQYLSPGAPSPVNSINTDSNGPWLPLDIVVSDYSDPLSLAQYGSWIFYRFLTEYFAEGAPPPTALTLSPDNGDPTVIRDIWNAAVGRATYSTKAIARVITARGSTFATVLQAFAVANELPTLFYSEGTLYNAAGVQDLPSGTTSTTWPMYHMADDYLGVVPNVTLPSPSSTSTLSIAFDLPDLVTGSAAAAIVIPTSGPPQVQLATLDEFGNGTLAGLPFSASTVQSVIVVLTNAGIDFTDCFHHYGKYLGRASVSCGGLPLEDSASGYAFTLSVAG